MQKTIDIEKFIKEIRFKKKSDILICIPTFYSYELTKKNIEHFLNQKDTNFDILIVGDEDDIVLLEKDFVNLNFVKTKQKNIGGTASKLIGISFALKYKYTYSMINDNDAFLLSDYSLKKMYDELRVSNNYIIRPLGELEESRHTKPFESKNPFCLYCCCLVKTEIFKLLPLPNINYFILHDDVAFYCNYSIRYKILIHPEIRCFHPLKLSFYKFTNLHKFYFTRSTLLGLKIEERNRLVLFYFLRFLIGFLIFIFYSIINLDFSYFKILYICFYQVLLNKFEIPDLPKDKFSYKKISEFDSDNFSKFPNYIDRVLPPRYLFLTDVYHKKTEIFKRIEN